MNRSLVLVLVVIGCSKPEEVTVKELGIKITVPGNWDQKQRDNDITFRSGIDGVILRGEKESVKSIEDARGRLIQGAKMREEKALPTGAFYFDYDVDYGTAGKPMILRQIEVLLPTATGHVSCTLQLQPSQDAEPIAKACSSMKLI